MDQKQYHKSIIDYYEKAEVSYKDVWDLNHSMAFHCGFWDDKVSSIRKALLRQNHIMAEWIGLSKEDHLLDAGCGIGGSAIYVAKHFGNRAVGISIVPYQVERAQDKAKEHGVEDKVKFEVADYCNMPFGDNTFSVVWAIESVCYARDKEAFLKEAYRVLKPGGRLIVADGYRVDKKLNQKEENIMHLWEEGYAVEQLAKEAAFSESIDNVGFINKVIKDATTLVMPSAKRLNYFGWAAIIYRKVLSVFGKKYGNEITIKNTQAAINQYLGIKKELWKYLVFMAEKPSN